MLFLMGFFTIIYYLKLAIPEEQQLCKTPLTGSLRLFDWVWAPRGMVHYASCKHSHWTVLLQSQC